MNDFDFSISKLNSKKKIYNILAIPKIAQTKSYDFSINYSYKFIDKRRKKDTRTFKELVLSLEKPSQSIVDVIPDVDNKKDYRPIINYLHGTEWLKKSQRKMHKILAKGIGQVDYLHSTLPKKSYATNGRIHANETRYMLCIDISSFFTQISIKRVFDTFKKYLHVDSDVADFYSKLCTAPLEKGSPNIVLAQGLPTSPILAYLCYKTLFDYINTIAIKNDLTFTLYVDDMTFSSSKEIPQSFIDTIIGLLKSKKYNNLLKINNKKIHLYKKEQNKKVTGVIIKNGVANIPSKKHYEIILLYDKLLELLSNEPYTFNDYIETYPYFLKYMGNVMTLFQVQYDMDLKGILSSKHAVYYRLYHDLIGFFKPGVKKNNKYDEYNISNIQKSDLKRMGEYYIKMLAIINHIRASYKPTKENNY